MFKYEDGEESTGTGEPYRGPWEHTIIKNAERRRDDGFVVMVVLAVIGGCYLLSLLFSHQ